MNNCHSGKRTEAASLSKESAIIVIDENAVPLVRLAAEELSLKLAKIMEGEVPIHTVLPAGDVYVYYVGRSRYTEARGIEYDHLHNDEFRILIDTSSTYLIGNDRRYQPKEPYPTRHSELDFVMKEWQKKTGYDWDNPLKSIYRKYDADLDIWEYDGCGTIYAVYEYLRSLGYHWFLPGELGEVIPSGEIEYPPCRDSIYRPQFPIRNHYHLFNNFFAASREEIVFRYQQGLNYGSEYLGHGEPGHGLKNVLSSKKLQQSHPEYYALVKGRRLNVETGKVLPCLSSRGLIEETTRYAKSVFEIYDEPAISIMPPDGFINACQCDSCKGWITKDRGRKGVYSDYVWHFVNEVAKGLLASHPDKKVVCFAYTTYLQPPLRIDALSPNVQVGIVRSRSMMKQPILGSPADSLIDAWLVKSSGRQLIFWDHYLFSRTDHDFNAVPVVFPRVIAQDLKDHRQKSLGEFIEVSRTYRARNLRSLATNHINTYVTTRMYWDVDADVDRILDDYYEGFYGEAARDMQTFFHLAEEKWKSLSNDVVSIAQLKKLLIKARDQNTDPKIAQRIGLVQSYIGPLELSRRRIAREKELIQKQAFRIMDRNRSPIHLDGRLQENHWAGLHPYPLDIVGQRRRGAIRFLRNRNDLVVGAEVSLGQKSDQGRYLNYGLVIDLDILDGNRYMIEVFANGNYTINRKDDKLNDWTLDLESKVTIDRGKMVVELKINASRMSTKEDDDKSYRLPTKTYPWFVDIYATPMKHQTDRSSQESSTRASRDKVNFRKLLIP